MAAVADLSLNDGQATPVAHTFAVKRVGDGDGRNTTLSEWEDRVGGIGVGYPRVSMQMRYPQGNVKSHKLTIKVAVPTLEVVSNSTVTGIAPAPTLSYTCLAVIDVILPERSALQNRKDVLAYVKNLLANAVVTSAVHDLAMPY